MPGCQLAHLSGVLPACLAPSAPAKGVHYPTLLLVAKRDNSSSGPDLQKQWLSTRPHELVPLAALVTCGYQKPLPTRELQIGANFCTPLRR